MRAFIFLMIMSTSSMGCETGPYFEFGVKAFDSKSAQPEISAPSPFGELSVGWQFKDGWEAGVTHESSIPHEEVGKGINGLFIRKRLWFK